MLLRHEQVSMAVLLAGLEARLSSVMLWQRKNCQANVDFGGVKEVSDTASHPLNCPSTTNPFTSLPVDAR